MLSSHYKKLLKYESLSKQETLLLISNVHKGDIESAWKLVIKNTKLIVKILNRHFPRHINDESFSDGILGLYMAIIRLNENSSFGRFLRYSISYIKGYVIKGIERRNTQLSPSRVRFGRFDRIEISKEKLLEEECEDIFGNMNEDLYFDSFETICRRDNNQFFNMIISNSCTNQTQKKVVCLLRENDGDCSKVAKHLKKTRQYIHTVKNQIRDNVKAYLIRNKVSAKEFENIC